MLRRAAPAARGTRSMQVARRLTARSLRGRARCAATVRAALRTSTARYAAHAACMLCAELVHGGTPSWCVAGRSELEHVAVAGAIGWVLYVARR